MQSPDPASSLSDDDLLSLSIGRVARAHARVEYGLRNVHEALDTPRSTDTVAAGFVGADRLANDCMLRRADLSRKLTESGERSLKAAQEANVLRNGIVHDLWLLESGGEDDVNPRWNTFGAARGRTGTVVRPAPSDIQTVEDARTALNLAAVRVSGLFMALHEVLPRYEGSPRRRGRTRGLPTYLALMDGNFRLAQNGDWEIVLPA
jgi:hypothetical protein